MNKSHLRVITALISLNTIVAPFHIQTTYAAPPSEVISITSSTTDVASEPPSYLNDIITTNVPNINHLSSIEATQARKSLTTPKQDLKSEAEQMVNKAFGEGQFEAFDWIITHESNWNTEALNSQSGAFGLAQFLPASKIGGNIHDPLQQISSAISYMRSRYGTPRNAVTFWLAHNWY